MKQNSRIAGLDALRGIAATWVMMWHFVFVFFKEYSEYPKPAFSFEGGRYGVWLFFAISGFVISMSLERVDKPFEFIKARAMRLYPTFIVSVISTFIIVKLLGLPGLEYSFREMLINLTMFARTFHVPYIDGAYWSLEVECFFYLIMFFVLCFKMRNQMHWVMIAMLGYMVLYRASYSINPSFGKALGHFVISDYIGFFIPGMCIYQWNKNKKAIYPIILVATLLLFLKTAGVATALVVAMASFFVYAATNGWLRWLENKPMLFLGTISYGLYLIHDYVGFAIMRKVLGLGINPNLAIVIAVMAVVMLAILLTFLVEQPTMNWYKKFRNSRKVKSQPAFANAVDQTT